MRDQIAIAAMGALITAYAELSTTEGYSANECSQDAYLYADMMMRERKIMRVRMPAKNVVQKWAENDAKERRRQAAIDRVARITYEPGKW